MLQVFFFKEIIKILGPRGVLTQSNSIFILKISNLDDLIKPDISPGSTIGMQPILVTLIISSLLYLTMAISNVHLKDDTQVKLMPNGLSPTCDDRCRGPSFS